MYWSDSIKKIIITNREVVLKINILNFFFKLNMFTKFNKKIKKVNANILKKKNLKEINLN